MLTINQITDNKEAVIAGLNKKHFANAGQVIAQVLDVNNQRKECQTHLDENLAQQNKIAKSIGLLMREGKKDEAEQAKADVAGLKADSKVMQDKKAELEEQLQQLFYTIPNVPYDEVPEGFGAEDNVVVKTGGTNTTLPENALPHWELAKKYNLIDFDLGVKITGAGFPVYTGLGARLQRA
ncbi:MAG: serine--tRNA ligase, partial [Bacteroidaceae bacterium]|nr:serine--tRNA ligase [Bacteroidaceae bacterium]